MKRPRKPRKRNSLAVDLATRKYRQRVIPNKKRQNKRSKAIECIE